MHPEFPLVVIPLAYKTNTGYFRVLAKDWRKHDPPELGCPDTDHSPKSQQNRNNVRHHELNALYISGQGPFEIKIENWKAYHLLRVYLPMALDVPKSDHADARTGHQHEAEVRIVQEREGEPEVLADVYQGHGCVYSLGGSPQTCQRRSTVLGKKFNPHRRKESRRTSK